MKVALLLTCFTVATRAQTTQQVLTNRLADLNWLMGNSPYWMTMNRGSLGTAVMTGKHPLEAGGASVASNPETGQLLFYTDGKAVYGANHALCANGDLRGTPVNDPNEAPPYDQPSAIGPWNTAGNRYVIFTNSEAGVKYSIVQVEYFAPALLRPPAATVLAKNTALGASAGTGLITVPHPNGTDFYVIYQSTALSKTLQVVTVVPNVSAALTPQTVTLAGAPDFTVKNFAYNNATKMLAITPDEGPVILAAVGANAAIAYKETLTADPAFDVSDSEFTLKGDYLFLSKKGTVGENGTANNDGGVLCYKVGSGATPFSVTGGALIRAGYDLQLAADGNIYHIYQAPESDNYLVGRLTGVGKTDAPAQYSLTVNENKIRIDNLGGARFPSFLPPQNLGVSADFDFAGTCLRAPTVFFPKTTPTADSVQWSFLEADKQKQTWSPVYRFKDPSNPVTMTAYYDGEEVRISKAVNLTDFNIKLALPKEDTTACVCELRKRLPKIKKDDNTIDESKNVDVPLCDPFFTLKATKTASPNVSYLWSTGAVTNEITIDTAGYYYVAVKDPNSGCTAYAGVTVNEYGREFTINNHYWYFGNRARINFTDRRRTRLPAPLANRMNVAQGCNLACDPMGNPIFYTDGMTVWDKKGNPLATNIGGSISTQTEVVQVPKDTTLFYIFTPFITQRTDGTEASEMRYSLFDLKQISRFNEMGDVTVKNQTLFSSSTERIFYDRGSSGGWLAGHEDGNNIFRAYKITDKGIGQPRTSAIGTVHHNRAPNMGAGQIKLSTAGVTGALAVAVSKGPTPAGPGVQAVAGFNRVELFKFDPHLGLMTDFKPIDCGRSGQVYGVAIFVSERGTSLFASVRSRNGQNGGNAGLYKFSIGHNAAPVLAAKISHAGNLGGMNYGPDGKLYISMNGSPFLGEISGPNGTPVFKNTLRLPAGTCSWGLPTWTSSHTGRSEYPVATLPSVCLGEPSGFGIAFDEKIDKIRWNFGNQKGWKPSTPLTVPPTPPITTAAPISEELTYTYPVTGGYNPKVQLVNRCIAKQGGCHKTFPVALLTGNLYNSPPYNAPPYIYNNSDMSCNDRNDSLILKTQARVDEPLKPLNIPSPAAICRSPSVILDANPRNLNGSNNSILVNGIESGVPLEFEWVEKWSGRLLGDKSVISLSAPAEVEVTVRKNRNRNRNGNGDRACSASQTVIVVDNRPKPLLHDVQLCEGEKGYYLESGLPETINSFKWHINGVETDNDKSKQEVNTANVRTSAYEVLVTVKDPDPSKQCFSQGQAAVIVKPNPHINVSPVNAPGCHENGQINIRINVTASDDHYAYSISKADWPAVSQTNLPAGSYTEAGIPTGTYTVTVTDENSACQTTQMAGVSGPDVFEWNHKTIGPKCDPVKLKVTAKNNKLGNPVVMSHYKITGPDGTPLEERNVTPLGNSFNTVNEFRKGVYMIEVRDLNGCVVAKPIDLDLISVAALAFSQNCLKLTASGAARYEWTANVPNAIATNPPVGKSIDMTPGAREVIYTVKGTIGECASFVSKSVNVPALLQPSIQSSDACSNKVTLTALPLGNYVYQWKKDGALTPDVSGSVRVDIADDGSRWSVKVRDNSNLCEAESPPTEAKIAGGTIDLKLASTLACEGEKFTLTARTMTAGVAYSWFLNALPVKDAVSPEYTTGDEGKFKVVASKRGCEAFAELAVSKKPVPKGRLPARFTVCADPENPDPSTMYAILNGGQFASYEWKKDDAVISTDQTVKTTEAGNYQVTYTSGNGCKNTEKTEVVMECLPKVVAPNAFRPLSEEENNRTFSVLSYLITDDFHIFIYNRWGEVVFESGSRNFKWNGGFQNDADHPVPGGVYIYVLRYNGKYQTEAARQEMRGGVLVVR